MFNKVMQGGACQPDGQQNGMQQNAFTNMIDNMLTGDAMAQQNAQGQVMAQNPQQQQNMEMMKQQFDAMQMQDMMSKEFQQQQQQNHFANVLSQQQNHQQMDLNSLWDEAGQTNAQSEQINSSTMQQPGGQFQQPWMNPMMMNRPLMYQQPMQNQNQQVIKEEVKQSENPAQQVSSNMVEVLQSSEDPKHRNSEFLKFLKQINQGALNIEGDKLVENTEKMAEFSAQEVIRVQADLVRQEEDAKFAAEHALHLQQLRDADDVDEIQDEHTEHKDLFHEGADEDLTEDQFDKMMEQWKEEGANAPHMQKMMEEWGKVWEQDAGLQGLNPMQKPNIIQFQSENKYMDDGQNLLEKAKQLIEEGKIQEAILCLEAEVQKNQENAEAWRILGQLFQENDQDEFAIIALRSAHDADPYDLESLLSLGISSTNELDQEEALKCLTNWLRFHPDFNGLPILSTAENLNLDQVEQAFIDASNVKQADTQVLTALGVLQFIRRDFNKAAGYFERAIKENPIDHSVWNKYGAALANASMSPELTHQAIAAYKQALDLRPNYVRTLVNIGLANNNQVEYMQGAECFLNALILNPKATHIWNYVRQSILQADRFDLLEKVEHKDPSMFAGEFNLINPSSLRQPTMDNLYNNKIFQS